MRCTVGWICFLVVVTTITWVHAAETAGRTATGKQAMVVSVSREASEAGLQALERGGNAVDATVATAFALTVTWPEAGNIGGGGFMLIHPGEGQPPVVIDYRETAPAQATREMFAAGNPSQYKLVGVPGTVRGLELAHRKWGKRPWGELLAPAIQLADKGLTVNDALAKSLNSALKKSEEFPELRRVFAPPQQRAEWQAGDRLVQPELAQTLRKIAVDGADAFYKGAIAEQLVVEMKRGGGIITLADLAAYEPKIREPLRTTFRGYEVFAPPPPSSGGPCLLEMLNILETFNLRQQPRFSPRTVHLMTEAMKRAYSDRARYLGDPDFTPFPAKLVMKEYARELAAGIDLNKTTPSEALAPDIKLAGESEQTTHFSVIDAQGMAIANTYTLEQSFGSRIVVRGAGFLLNNEMGDFNPQPGVTTRTGQIGTAPNEVRPGKRMLSSMCPTIATKDGRVVLVTGSPGGRTIINTVLNVVISKLEYELPLEEAVAGMRSHHQWFPDRLQLEAGPAKEHAELIEALKKLGHNVQLRPGTQGDAHSIWIEKPGQIEGVADPRRDGWAAGK